MRCEAIRCSKLVHPLGWRWGCLTLSRFVSQQEKQNNPSGYVKTPKFDIFQKKLEWNFSLQVPLGHLSWRGFGFLWSRQCETTTFRWLNSWRCLVSKGGVAGLTGCKRTEQNGLECHASAHSASDKRATAWVAFFCLVILDQAFVEMLSPKHAFLLFELGGKFCLATFCAAQPWDDRDNHCKFTPDRNA